MTLKDVIAVVKAAKNVTELYDQLGGLVKKAVAEREPEIRLKIINAFLAKYITWENGIQKVKINQSLNSLLLQEKKDVDNYQSHGI